MVQGLILNLTIPAATRMAAITNRTPAPILAGVELLFMKKGTVTNAIMIPTPNITNAMVLLAVPVLTDHCLSVV